MKRWTILAAALAAMSSAVAIADQSSAVAIADQSSAVSIAVGADAAISADIAQRNLQDRDFPRWRELSPGVYAYEGLHAPDRDGVVVNTVDSPADCPAARKAQWGRYGEWALRDSQAPLAIARVYQELDGMLPQLRPAARDAGQVSSTGRARFGSASDAEN